MERLCAAPEIPRPDSRGEKRASFVAMGVSHGTKLAISIMDSLVARVLLVGGEGIYEHRRNSTPLEEVEAS